MDHLAFSETIARLRDEIAHIQKLNERYRATSQHRNETEARIDHSLREERLREIRAELVQFVYPRPKNSWGRTEERAAGQPSESRRTGFVALSIGPRTPS